ncbi:FAD-binding oxidoreductase [Acetonema longum]|uniref:D-lactate dehydrogenase (cytochrome) n=1 Tax=Acetonema longum DSM 6540 TaxID=1009370 RepID=F7NNI9_9FIRM|nr:FAD-linked oxidase C-terminal domain-containing protein [Acetonema longum]EGO62430.1 FAD/FMN-containing dehydrogenase [Acetonema longum DSM 6540]
MNSTQLGKLRKIAGHDRIHTEESALLCYAYDSSLESQIRSYMPEAVFVPQAAAEIPEVIQYCAAERIPIIPRGAGTGQAGGSLAVKGGLVIDLSRLNRILEIDTDNLQVIVEPGVVHAELNQALAPLGFSFPPDPGSTKMATVGGMISYNASGMRAMKYGTTREYVLGLEVIMASGQVITTGGVECRSLKTVSGYDLTKLFVGTEGTLGIITKARLKIMPLPEKKGLAVASFAQLGDAGKAVGEVFRNKIVPAAIEVLDKSAIKAACMYKPSIKLPEDAAAVLFFEVDGPPPGVVYQAQKIAEVCKSIATHVDWTDDPDKVKQLWEARSVVGAASGRVRPGATRVYIGEDICVPIMNVGAALEGIQKIGQKYGTVIVTYGHVADGNFHSAPVIDMESEEELRKVQLVADEIQELALDLKGTVTGEHGIGVVRAKYMDREHGPAVEVMRVIKSALDPLNIMNPGKMGLDRSGEK